MRGGAGCGRHWYEVGTDFGLWGRNPSARVSRWIVDNMPDISGIWHHATVYKSPTGYTTYPQGVRRCERRHALLWRGWEAYGKGVGHMANEDGAPRLLTVKETAKLLGISQSTVRGEIMAGCLPSLKIGRARRIPSNGLRWFIRARLTEEEARLNSSTW